MGLGSKMGPGFVREVAGKGIRSPEHLPVGLALDTVPRDGD
jgi:hypothetical protein